MIDPTRLTDEKDAVGSDEWRILAADTGFHAPAMAKANVWASIAAAVGATAAGVSLSSNAAASSAAAGSPAIAAAASGAHGLTFGAVTKWVLLGVGIGTSLATVGHIGFEAGAADRPRAVQPSPPLNAPGTRASAAPSAVASGATPPSSVPVPIDGNPQDRFPASRAASSQPVEEPPLASSPNDEQPREAQGSKSQSLTLPESNATQTSASAREESLLVNQARSMLRSRNPGNALALLDRAASRFPQGILIQEREALRVETLVALDRVGEARVRAQAFVAAYPKSPYLARVTNVLSVQRH